ncbi:MAG: DNA polymerase III subunit delta' [Alphaproteobacteria bacterium]|nr:MAG: DNA polymerase III subunit delta' [Alphaproteobacteria bacterium]
MAEAGELPEPDRLDGAPHPREAARLFGQAPAEAAFLEAFNAGRLHHAWMLAGPEGVGKATLAWRIARFLLATPDPAEAGGGLFGAPEPPASLEIDPDHPVARRLRAAGADPGLFVLRRGPNDKGDRLSADIRINEARRLKAFLALSPASESGRRVVIVDAADEMNPATANAVLKLLEEPPAGTILLLVAHQPSRLLPTIRSRCRVLRLAPLGPDDLAAALAQAGAEPGDEAPALTALAGGSVRAALGLLQNDGLAIYREILRIFEAAPRHDRQAALALAGSVSGAANAQRLDLVIWLIARFLARLARTGAGLAPTPEAAPGEAELLARLAPGPDAARRWAALQQSLSARADHARAVNLDPAALILDMVFRINETAAGEAA